MLNSRDQGTLIGPTFRLTLDPSQLAAENVLEIHVSNLMANRIAALDKAGVRWRKFYNVNFPARLPGESRTGRLVQRRRVGSVGLRPARSGDAHSSGVSEVGHGA